MSPPSAKQLLKQAKAALSDKDFETALKTCREILKTDKQNYHAFVFVGVATGAQGDVERAIQSYQRAIKLRPSLPLAYKGLIDALSGTTQSEHRLILARAHVELGRLSSQHADKSLSTAASMFYSLAIEDPMLTSEAVDVMRAFQQHPASTSDEQAAQTTYRIARLLLKTHDIRLVDDADRLKEALETNPLAEALNEYEKLLTSSPRPPLEADVSQFVVKRAVLRCLRDHDFESNLDVLRKAGAYEAVLEVAEMDKATAGKAPERALLSMRLIHLHPFAKSSTRSRYIFAAELFSKTQKLDIASRISRVDAALTAKQTGLAAKLPIYSCTQAVVNAFFHLKREEYKLASLVALEGQKITAGNDSRRRCEACFNLLHAAALCGDRKYSESLKAYNSAKIYGQREGHSWIENASHQGIVRTSVLAYGRRSRQASTAVEEAAGSSSGVFGLLECAWTDALAGDIDILRMEQLVNQATDQARLATDQAHLDRRPSDFLDWECSIMDSTFVRSMQEIAAINKTRLGQAIIQDTGGTTDGLLQAKHHQMEAATIFKGLPDPFAQLGYILERLSERGDDDKMLYRAIRCYEKAISFDPAHPVASRRLTQLLLRRGQIREASYVAQHASEKNPKARWAHNVTGWQRLSDGRPVEAAVSFRNALRGKPKVSSKEEEIIFGTNIGQTEDDNLLLVDIDSWRGLCAAYMKMGKLGPAVACLEDALALAQAPPKFWVSNISANVAETQKALRPILEAEKGLILLSQRNTPVTAAIMDSIRSSIVSLALTQYSLSDAFLTLATEQWMKGCYSRATHLRQTAAQLTETAVQSLSEKHPQQNATCVLKRLGDVLMEVITSNPLELLPLVGKTVIDQTLKKAVTAYARALHFSPWQSKERIQDMIAALILVAQTSQDAELGCGAVNIVASSKLDATLGSIALLQAGTLAIDGALRDHASSVARRVSNSSHSNSYAVELSTAISCHGCQDVVSPIVDSAVMAIRQNPVDWRGWYAVGKVRELDASANGWPQDVTKSCEQAYNEADRLGGGPAAVAGRVRCALFRLRDFLQEMTEDISHAYSQASLGASNAARIGIDEPSICREVIDRHRQNVESTARESFRGASFESRLKLQRNLHFFPFLEEAVSVFRTSVTQPA